MKENISNEENEMYGLLADAIFSFCDSKPKNAIETLSKNLLTQVGEDPNLIQTFSTKKKITQENQILVLKDTENIHKKRIFNDEYKILKKISGTTSGEVFIGHSKSRPDQKYAIKIIKKDETNNFELSDSKIEFLLGLDHPNIIKIHDLINEDKNIFIVSEYSEIGDLYKYLKNRKSYIDEKTVKSIAYQLLNALIYLHGKKVIHRDIRPENVIVIQQEPELIVKLTDFYNASFYIKNKELNHFLGVPQFSSPELINGSFDEKTDIWSIGVLIYKLICGQFPFRGKDTEILIEILCKPIIYEKHHSESSVKFISKLLERNPRKRLSAKQAIEDEYFITVSNFEISEELNKEAFINMNQFLVNNIFKKAVLDYVLSRKKFEETNLELVKLFEKIDKDRNGEIDINELFAYYGKYFPGTVEEEWDQIRELMNNIDLNKSGKITYTEFMIVSNDINKTVNSKLMREMFELFDIDHSNYIESNDLKKIFKDKSLKTSQIQTLIDEYDTDHDKKISFKEFSDMLTSIY